MAEPPGLEPKIHLLPCGRVYGHRRDVIAHHVVRNHDEQSSMLPDGDHPTGDGVEISFFAETKDPLDLRQIEAPELRSVLEIVGPDDHSSIPFLGSNYDYVGLYSTGSGALTICEIVLPFRRVVNGISTGLIGTKAAPTVGIILIWPTNVEVVPSRWSYWKGGDTSDDIVDGVTIVAAGLALSNRT